MNTSLSIKKDQAIPLKKLQTLLHSESISMPQIKLGSHTRIISDYFGESPSRLTGSLHFDVGQAGSNTFEPFKRERGRLGKILESVSSRESMFPIGRVKSQFQMQSSILSEMASHVVSPKSPKLELPQFTSSPKKYQLSLKMIKLPTKKLLLKRIQDVNCGPCVGYYNLTKDPSNSPKSQMLIPSLPRFETPVKPPTQKVQDTVMRKLSEVQELRKRLSPNKQLYLVKLKQEQEIVQQKIKYNVQPVPLDINQVRKMDVQLTDLKKHLRKLKGEMNVWMDKQMSSH